MVDFKVGAVKNLEVTLSCKKQGKTCEKVYKNGAQQSLGFRRRGSEQTMWKQLEDIASAFSYVDYTVREINTGSDYDLKIVRYLLIAVLL